jgi:hypothetical protein
MRDSVCLWSCENGHVTSKIGGRIVFAVFLPAMMQYCKWNRGSYGGISYVERSKNKTTSSILYIFGYTLKVQEELIETWLNGLAPKR